MFKPIFSLRKGAGLVLALSFCVSNAEAGDANQHILPNEAIEQASQALAQKDRVGALKILATANKRTIAAKDLQVAFDEIAETFLTEKAQQNYELGVSLRKTDPNMAVSKLNDALKDEPDNQTVLVELARLQLQLGDCSTAIKTLEKASSQNPGSEVVTLQTSQAELCLGHFEKALALRPSDLRHSKFLVFWQLVEIERRFRSGQLEQGLALVQDTLDAKPSLSGPPELFYWRWKIADQLKKTDEKAAVRYVRDCQKLNSRQARDYAPEPKTCLRTSEVENFLKKSHNADK